MHSYYNCAHALLPVTNHAIEIICSRGLLVVSCRSHVSCLLPLTSHKLGLSQLMTPNSSQCLPCSVQDYLELKGQLRTKAQPRTNRQIRTKAQLEASPSLSYLVITSDGKIKHPIYYLCLQPRIKSSPFPQRSTVIKHRRKSLQIAKIYQKHKIDSPILWMST